MENRRIIVRIVRRVRSRNRGRRRKGIVNRRRRRRQWIRRKIRMIRRAKTGEKHKTLMRNRA